MHRILLVDDDPDLLVLHVRAFKPLGGEFEVATASGGKAAMRELAASRFDVVVLDLLMPGRDGLETLAEIRNVHPDVKVIAMSGGAQRLGMDLLSIAVKLGASCELTKPFTHEQLVTVVRGLLTK